MSDEPTQRATVKRNALHLNGLIGIIKEDDKHLWDVVSSYILGQDWNEGHARIFICWLSSSGSQEG